MDNLFVAVHTIIMSYTPKHFYRTLCRAALCQFRNDPFYTHANMFASSKHTLHCVWSTEDDSRRYTVHTYGKSTNVYHTFLNVVKIQLRSDSRHISPSLLQECMEVICKWKVDAYYVKS